MAKKFRNNNELTGFDGNPVRVPLKSNGSIVSEWGYSTYDMFQVLLLNASTKTQNDCIQGSRLFKALEDGKNEGYIVLEDGVYDWLRDIAESLTPMIFRYNGNIVYEFIKDGFEKD